LTTTKAEKDCERGRRLFLEWKGPSYFRKRNQVGRRPLIPGSLSLLLESVEAG